MSVTSTYLHIQGTEKGFGCGYSRVSIFPIFSIKFNIQLFGRFSYYIKTIELSVPKVNLHWQSFTVNNTIPFSSLLKNSIFNIFEQNLRLVKSKRNIRTKNIDCVKNFHGYLIFDKKQYDILFKNCNDSDILTQGKKYFYLFGPIFIPRLLRNIYFSSFLDKIEEDYFWPGWTSYIPPGETELIFICNWYKDRRFKKRLNVHIFDGIRIRFYEKILYQIHEFMFNKSKLGTFYNTTVYVHNSFYFILIFFLIDIIIFFNDGIFNLFVLIFLHISVLLHEFGHLFAAKKLKFETGDILLTPVGGMASINYYSQYNNHIENDEIIISITGPIVSFILAIFFFSLDILIYNSEFLEKIGYLNLMLGTFNLLPIFPLDGGRIFRAFATKFGVKKGIKLSEIITILTIICVIGYSLFIELNIFLVILMTIVFFLFIHQNNMDKKLKLGV